MAERPEATDLITAVSNAFKRNGSDARPPAAPATSADHRQLLDTIERQRKALRQLRESHEDLTKKVEALEKRTKSLLGVFDQLNALPEQRQALESQVSSARIQQVAGVIGNVQAAAFGDAGSIFTRNNLFLAGNQLFWIFLDPVLRRLGMIERYIAEHHHVAGAGGQSGDRSTGSCEPAARPVHLRRRESHSSQCDIRCSARSCR